MFHLFTLFPLPLKPTDLFILDMILLYPECLIVKIIPYVVFSDWLPSLSNMYLSFLHVFSSLDSSSYLSAK